MCSKKNLGYVFGKCDCEHRNFNHVRNNHSNNNSQDSNSNGKEDSNIYCINCINFAQNPSKYVTIGDIVKFPIPQQLMQQDKQETDGMGAENVDIKKDGNKVKTNVNKNHKQQIGRDSPNDSELTGPAAGTVNPSALDSPHDNNEEFNEQDNPIGNNYTSNIDFQETDSKHFANNYHPASIVAMLASNHQNKSNNINSNTNGGNNNNNNNGNNVNSKHKSENSDMHRSKDFSKPRRSKFGKPKGRTSRIRGKGGKKHAAIVSGGLIILNTTYDSSDEDIYNDEIDDDGSYEKYENENANEHDETVVESDYLVGVVRYISYRIAPVITESYINSSENSISDNTSKSNQTPNLSNNNNNNNNNNNSNNSNNSNKDSITIPRKASSSPQTTLEPSASISEASPYSNVSPRNAFNRSSAGNSSLPRIGVVRSNTTAQSNHDDIEFSARKHIITPHASHGPNHSQTVHLENSQAQSHLQNELQNELQNGQSPHSVPNKTQIRRNINYCLTPHSLGVELMEPKGTGNGWLLDPLLGVMKQPFKTLQNHAIYIPFDNVIKVHACDMFVTLSQTVQLLSLKYIKYFQKDSMNRKIVESKNIEINELKNEISNLRQQMASLTNQINSNIINGNNKSYNPNHTNSNNINGTSVNNVKYRLPMKNGLHSINLQSNQVLLPRSQMNTPNGYVAAKSITNTPGNQSINSNNNNNNNGGNGNTNKNNNNDGNNNGSRSTTVTANRAFGQMPNAVCLPPNFMNNPKRLGKSVPSSVYHKQIALNAQNSQRGGSAVAHGSPMGIPANLPAGATLLTNKGNGNLTNVNNVSNGNNLTNTKSGNNGNNLYTKMMYTNSGGSGSSMIARQFAQIQKLANQPTPRNVGVGVNPVNGQRNSAMKGVRVADVNNNNNMNMNVNGNDGNLSNSTGNLFRYMGVQNDKITNVNNSLRKHAKSVETTPMTASMPANGGNNNHGYSQSHYAIHSTLVHALQQQQRQNMNNNVTLTSNNINNINNINNVSNINNNINNVNNLGGNLHGSHSNRTPNNTGNNTNQNTGTSNSRSDTLSMSGNNKLSHGNGARSLQYSSGSIPNESESDKNINSNTNNHDRNSNGSDENSHQSGLSMSKNSKTSRRRSHSHHARYNIGNGNNNNNVREDNSGDGTRRHGRAGPPLSVGSKKSTHLTFDHVAKIKLTDQISPQPDGPTNIGGYRHLPCMKPELSVIESTGMDLSGSIGATPQTNDTPEVGLNIGGTLPKGKFLTKFAPKKAEATEDEDSQDHVFGLNLQTPNHSNSTNDDSHSLAAPRVLQNSTQVQSHTITNINTNVVKKVNINPEDIDAVVVVSDQLRDKINHDKSDEIRQRSISVTDTGSRSGTSASHSRTNSRSSRRSGGSHRSHRSHTSRQSRGSGRSRRSASDNKSVSQEITSLRYQNGRSKTNERHLNVSTHPGQISQLHSTMTSGSMTVTSIDESTMLGAIMQTTIQSGASDTSHRTSDPLYEEILQKQALQKQASGSRRIGDV